MTNLKARGTKVDDFLAQKRIAVVGVSRDDRHHPVGNLIYRRLKETGHEVFAVNPNMQAGIRRVWMHRSMGGGSSVSPEAVEYCRRYKIEVIAGACPMMFGPDADLGHTCMRWVLGLTGGLPS